MLAVLTDFYTPISAKREMLVIYQHQARSSNFLKPVLFSVLTRSLRIENEPIHGDIHAGRQNLHSRDCAAKIEKGVTRTKPRW